MTDTTGLEARIQELLTEELLILAEAEDGASVPFATRPLTDQERRSGVRFSQIHAAHTEWVTEVTPVVGHLMGVAVGEVLGVATGGAQKVLESVAGWRSELPEGLGREASAAVPVVRGALGRLFRRSARLVREEAARQGVRLPDREPPVPVWVPAAAETVVAAPINRVFDAARDLFSSPRAVAVAPDPVEVETVLGGLSERGPLDRVSQVGNAVVSGGRVAAVESAAEDGREPAWLYASELLDGATCSECRRVDGREWDTLAEARKFYPPGGGYVACKGGGRCRGTLVIVWEDEDED